MFCAVVVTASDHSVISSNLPMLYRVDQPTSNVVVFRGYDYKIAQQTGLLGPLGLFGSGSLKATPTATTKSPTANRGYSTTTTTAATTTVATTTAAPETTTRPYPYRPPSYPTPSTPAPRTYPTHSTYPTHPTYPTHHTVNQKYPSSGPATSTYSQYPPVSFQC